MRAKPLESDGHVPAQRGGRDGITLPCDLIIYKKDTILWGYMAVGALFLFPIGLISLWHEYTRWQQRRAK